MMNNPLERIKYYIDDNGCWIVESGAYMEKQGYYIISLNGKRARLHRAIMAYYSIGILNKSDVVCHTCDNKSCINPDHLYIGTKKLNTKDMLDRCRQSDWSDRNGKRQKLSRKQIIEIYNSELSSYELSALYGITDVQARRIKNGSRCSSITKRYSDAI